MREPRDPDVLMEKFVRDYDEMAERPGDDVSDGTRMLAGHLVQAIGALAQAKAIEKLARVIGAKAF